MSKRVHKQSIDDPSQEFLEAVRDVTPLPASDRVVHEPKRRTPLPFQRQQDDRQVLEDSLKEQIPADLELEAGDEMAFLRPGLARQVLRKLRSGHWAIQDELDLHGLRAEEARNLLVDFLAQASKRGYRCVLIVHGKGLKSQNREPVLKRKVAGWLAQKGSVLAFCQARPADGGGGAVAVLLKGAGKAPEAISDDDL
jgi:DNA-nicking Smr family endonuclease